MILFSPNRLHYSNFGALCALYCIYVLWACHIIEKKVNIVCFAWKLAEHSRIMILIPTLIFWISNPKSIFWKILSERVKAICFAWKLAHTHTHTHTHTHRDRHIHTHRILRMVILILRLVFWNSKPIFIFWANLSQKSWILRFAWKLVYKVS